VNGRPGKHLAMGAFGLALGFTISAAGLSDWGEVHRMFSLGLFAGGPTVDNLRLLLGFAGAVALSLAGFQLLARHDQIPVKPIRTGTITGALAFGAGWAITGACPAAALVQLGEGKLAALATLGGILAGAWIHEKARRRFHWSRHSCVD
jgi:uncharacterized membrane protein YedE/YeeE